MEHSILTPWQQFGLVGLMMGAIVTLLFIIIKWTLATTKEILAQAKEERLESAKERECWIKAFNLHTDQAKSFHDEVKTAHEHQRKEHERLQEQQIKAISCLDQVEKALGRINGYK